MNKSLTNKRLGFLLLFAMVITNLIGCSKPITPSATLATPPPTVEVVPTVTATAVPEKIVLYDPASQAEGAMVQILSEFASANGLGIETWNSLSGSYEGIRIIVLHSQPENLAEIAASAPQTQFVVNSSAITPAGNISTLSVNPTHLAFLAGFLAAMTSTEWRAGALMVDDAVLGLADAFTNGGAYHCGRCTPIYTPMKNYPQVYILGEASDATGWSAQAAALYTDTAVNSVYIAPSADFPEVLDQFPNAVFYGSNPTSPNLARYAAILGADLTSALQLALPDLLAGNGSKTITARVGLVIINNEQIVTPGKQALFNQVAQALVDNLINPLSVP